MSQYATKRMGHGNFNAGVIPAGGQVIIPMDDAPLPATIAIHSTNSTPVTVSYCADGQQLEYFGDTATYTSATMKLFQCSISVSHLKITGTPGDVWNVR